MMRMAKRKNLPLPIFLVLLVLITGSTLSKSARVFTIINNCGETIWPTVAPGDYLGNDSLTLKPGQSIVYTVPVEWFGSIWARTGCNFDRNRNGSCQTGSCGSALKTCSTTNRPRASLAEFAPDQYYVSLVDGFNLPVVVTPVNGRGDCRAASCDVDLRPTCPKELAVSGGGKTIGCRNACDAFGTDEYCCRGVYGNPVTCRPTYYSKLFKQACPSATSYAYDDASVFTCSGADYVVSFCSSRNETVCAYDHDNKLLCNGTRGVWAIYGKWWIMMIFTLLITGATCNI